MQGDGNRPALDASFDHAALENQVPIGSLRGQFMLVVVHPAFAPGFKFRFPYQPLHAAESAVLDLIEFHTKTKAPIRIVAHYGLSLEVFERVVGSAIQLAVDAGNLPAPTAPLRVFQAKQFIGSPVKVISDEGHLLAQLPLGIGPQASPTA